MKVVKIGKDMREERMKKVENSKEYYIRPYL